MTTHIQDLKATPPQWFEKPTPCFSCKQWPECKTVPSPAKLLRLVAIISKRGNDEIATCNDLMDDEIITQKSVDKQNSFTICKVMIKSPKMLQRKLKVKILQVMFHSPQKMQE